MTDTERDLVREVAERTGHGQLTVYAALSRVTRARAVRMVGEEGVRDIEHVAAQVKAEGNS